MIIFDGMICGEAEKFFYKKSRYYGIKAFLIGMTVFLPFFLIITIITKFWLLMAFYALTLFIFPLCFLLPKTKKEKLSCLPRKIIIRNDELVCITEKATETKEIIDVKTVIDHGDFYEIVFLFGRISEKFICQKSLIAQGTLVEFEKLFEEKLIKKNRPLC